MLTLCGALLRQECSAGAEAPPQKDEGQESWSERGNKERGEKRMQQRTMAINHTEGGVGVGAGRGVS